MANQTGPEQKYSEQEYSGESLSSADEGIDSNKPTPEVNKRSTATLPELRRRLRIFGALFALALVGSFYGLFLDDRQWDNPFTKTPDLWEMLTKWQPHPALAEMPVVPAGVNGTLIYRPKDMSWIFKKEFERKSPVSSAVKGQVQPQQHKEQQSQLLLGTEALNQQQQQQLKKGSLLKEQDFAQQQEEEVQQEEQPAQQEEEPVGQSTAEVRGAFCLVDGLHCWVVGTEGMIQATSNGGISWDESLVGEEGDINWVGGTEKVGAVGENGLFLFSEDGGVRWETFKTYDNHNLIYFQAFKNNSDKTSGVLIDGKNQILVEADGLNLWHSIENRGENTIRSAFFFNEVVGWVVGGKGSILKTNDGARSWQVMAIDTNHDLTALYFQGDGNIGWVSASSKTNNGRLVTLYQTIDGGENWEELSYRYLPAAWVLYLAFPLLFLSFGGLAVTGVEIRRTPEASPGIEGVGSTDKPIGWDDVDHLRIKPLARSISRFLRNDHTKPPLTVAITGEWGKGKSSLMNLIAEDLKRYDAHPVWFNAWHHQKEEHLLAALLENIRVQAFPGWWRITGLMLRARLIWRRSKRDLKAIIAFAIIATLILFVGLAVMPFFSGNAVQFSGDVKEDILEFVSSIAKKGLFAQIMTGFGLSASSLIAVGIILRAARKLQIVSLNPASLMASISKRSSIGQFGDQLGFRYKFKSEFEDICIAMRQTTKTGMVIMIDDLDRCRPESVLEILEAVNFLVTAGPCYIFLGIDVPKVRDAVAFGFKDSALNLSDADTEEPASLEVNVKDLKAFADNYLKKLINIPVAVPTLSEEDSREFAKVRRTDSEKISLWPERIRTFMRNGTDCLGALLILSVLGVFLFQTSILITGAPDKEKEITAPQEQAKNPTVKPTQEVDEKPELTSVPKKLVVEVSKPTVEKEKLIGSRWDTILGIGVFLGTFFFLYLARRVTVVPDGAVTDTATFRDALELWNPAIFAANPTPRDMKRYHNRLRFNAMRLRRDAVQKGWLEKLFNNPSETEQSVTDIPEPTLVALGAIESFAPDLIKEHEKSFDTKKFHADIRDKLKALNGENPTKGANGKNTTQTILQKFMTTFPKQWPPNAEQMHQYSDLSRTLDTRPPDA